MNLTLFYFIRIENRLFSIASFALVFDYSSSGSSRSAVAVVVVVCCAIHW